MQTEDEDLRAAVNAGLLTDEQQKSLRAFIRQRRQSRDGLSDEEPLRLITGFSDIFVGIACLMVVISSSWLASNFTFMWQSQLVGGMAIITSWALAEYFTRIRHMAFPSILLLLTCVIGGFLLANPDEIAIGKDLWFFQPIVAVIVAALHWWRFRVPITVAIGMACLAMLAFILVKHFDSGLDFFSSTQLLVSFISGLVIMGLAMWWDTKDKYRKSYSSDVAFWLHLLAAPLLVHPFFTFFTDAGPDSLIVLGGVLVSYIGLSVISLIIDRRALMVSALGYVIWALSDVIDWREDITVSFALACLILGLFLISLSAGWHRARRLILRFFPQIITSHVPPLMATTRLNR